MGMEGLWGVPSLWSGRLEGAGHTGAEAKCSPQPAPSWAPMTFGTLFVLPCAKPLPGAPPLNLQLQPKVASTRKPSCPLTAYCVPHLTCFLRWGCPGLSPWPPAWALGMQPRALPRLRTHASIHPGCGPHRHRTRHTCGPRARPLCPAVTRSKGGPEPRPRSPVAPRPAPASSPGGSQLGTGLVRPGWGEPLALVPDPHPGPTQRARVGQEGGEILLL